MSSIPPLLTANKRKKEIERYLRFLWAKNFNVKYQFTEIDTKLEAISTFSEIEKVLKDVGKKVTEDKLLSIEYNEMLKKVSDIKGEFFKS